jgi:hypothetical protein
MNRQFAWIIAMVVFVNVVILLVGEGVRRVSKFWKARAR